MDVQKEINKEKIKFLERDFNQCFSQIRHYDSQIIDIFKFGFTFYTFVIGAIIGLSEFAKKENLHLLLGIQAVLILGILCGLFILWLMVRNRVYFVKVTRYINEHRRFFLDKELTGFSNESRMYDDPDYPKFFSWRSSHALFFYMSSILNSGLIITLFHFLKVRTPILTGIILFIILTTIQILLSFLLLREQEKYHKKKKKRNDAPI